MQASVHIQQMIKDYQIEAIAIGNGTASRETKAFIEGLKKGEDFPSVARALSAGGRVSVLMKAGHLGGSDASDLFYNAEEDRISLFSHPRIDTPNTHGTGCTLSSALASYLAQGLPLDDAVGAAIDYISGAIASGAAYSIGHGHGPVDHFYRTRK